MPGQDFSSRAAAKAATIASTTEYITTMGFYALGDGGGGTYKRVAAMPVAHQAYFASADGAYWEIIPPVEGLTPRQLGAYGNASVNTSFSWTEQNYIDPPIDPKNPVLEDDTRPLQYWIAACLALNCPMFIGEGMFLGSQQLTQGDPYASNLIMYGLGPEKSKLVCKLASSSPAARFISFSGQYDLPSSTSVYLTANLASGTSLVTVNDTSTMTEGMYVSFVDYSVPYNNVHTGSIDGYQGFVGQISTINSATQFSLVGVSEFDMSAGTASGNTRILRYFRPATDLAFHDFSVEFDRTMAYTTTLRMIYIAFAVNVRFENLLTNWAQIDEYNLVNCLYPKWINCETRRGVRIPPAPNNPPRPNDTDAYTVKATSCHFGEVSNYRMTGGRHLTDGYAGADGLFSSHFLVTDCIATNTFTGPFNTHSGARNWTFADCVALDVNPSVTTAAGFIVRGRAMRIVNPVVDRAPTGILCVYNQDVHIEGGQLRNCTDAFNVGQYIDAKVTGTTVIAPTNSVVNIQNSPSTTGYDFRRIQVQDAGSLKKPVTGPGGSVLVTNGVVDPTWVFDIDAPQATTYQTGTTIPANQIIKYVTANRF